jgi:membrane protease YdiL (CAAX protease family)
MRRLLAILGQAATELRDKPALVLLSAILGLVIWGPKGDPIFSVWLEPLLGATPAERAFRRQLLSYATGFVLLGGVPFLLIRLRFKERLRDYGLGAGDVRLGLTFALVLASVCLVPFLLASGNPAMRAEYPLLYRGLDPAQIRDAFSWPRFVVYELLYATFFFCIEFTFRGYLLFGLRERFGSYAILVQMLPYTAWHLPKPVVELAGTPLWGFAVAAITLRVGSIWYVFAVHWLLNVVMDTAIVLRLGVG